MSKKSYRIELKIKEDNGNHLTTIDHYKNISPEYAIVILTRKYINRKNKKGLMARLDAIYNELVGDIEKAIEKR